MRPPIEGRDQVSIYFRHSLVGSIDTTPLPAAPLAQAATMLSLMSTWERTWSTPLAQRLLCPAVDGNLMVAEARAGRIVLTCPEFPHRPVETVDLQLGRRTGRWPSGQRHSRPSRTEVAVERRPAELAPLQLALQDASTPLPTGSRGRGTTGAESAHD